MRHSFLNLLLVIGTLSVPSLSLAAEAVGTNEALSRVMGESAIAVVRLDLEHLEPLTLAAALATFPDLTGHLRMRTTCAALPRASREAGVRHSLPGDATADQTEDRWCRGALLCSGDERNRIAPHRGHFAAGRQSAQQSELEIRDDCRWRTGGARRFGGAGTIACGRRASRAIGSRRDFWRRLLGGGRGSLGRSTPSTLGNAARPAE